MRIGSIKTEQIGQEILAKMTRQTRKADVDAQIDANLKRAFDDMAGEPVPDRFTDLLKQLRSGAPVATDKGARDDD